MSCLLNLNCTCLSNREGNVNRISDSKLYRLFTSSSKYTWILFLISGSV